MAAVHPGGKRPASGRNGGGFHCLESAWFENKLDVFHVENPLLKGIGGDTEGGSATGFACLILAL